MAQGTGHKRRHKDQGEPVTVKELLFTLVIAILCGLANYFLLF